MEVYWIKTRAENIRDKLLRSFPEDFRENLKKAKDEKAAKKVIKTFLDSFHPSFYNLNPVIETGLTKILNDRKKEIINPLEKVYRKPLLFKKVTIYLTTFSICSYSYEEKWFMSGRNASIESHIDTSKHELNHFMFYYYYLNKLDKLGVSKEKRERLKEALAILTNPEGNDKPAVKKLENYLKTLAGKPMDEIISLSLKSGLI